MEASTSFAKEVDIWRIDLAGQGDGIQQCHGVLSKDEVQRAQGFYFERDRRRFTVARAAMREILSRYVGLAPQHLCFSYGPRGKPELCGPKQSGIKFNLSHSSEIALLAVTHGLAVGIDVEWINIDFATDEIATRSFSLTEVLMLQSLAVSQRTEAFFSCWTRKEAYIKALGEGLSVPLDSFIVGFAPGTPPALLCVEADATEVERWSMYNIELGEGYKAALVIEGKDHRVEQMQWSCALFKKQVST